MCERSCVDKFQSGHDLAFGQVTNAYGNITMSYSFSRSSRYKKSGDILDLAVAHDYTSSSKVVSGLQKLQLFPLSI